MGLLDFARGSTEVVQDSLKTIRNTVRCGSAGLLKLLSDWLNQACKVKPINSGPKEQQAHSRSAVDTQAITCINVTVDSQKSTGSP